MFVGVLTTCHTQYTWDRSTLYVCTDGSRNCQSFLLWCAVCSSYAFLRLERSLLRWRRTANRWHATDSLERTRFSCWCLWNHKGCTYRAHVSYVTETWSVVLLNKKIHVLLSQVYCVWQVVKTPTIILNNPVFVVTFLSVCTAWYRSALTASYVHTGLCVCVQFVLSMPSALHIFLFSPGATTPSGGCILQPSCGL